MGVRKKGDDISGDIILVTFRVSGITELMMGAPRKSTKKDTETDSQFEERTWPEKVRRTKEGQVYLNSFCVTNSLVSAGAWLSRKMEGRKTYTDRFKKGVSPQGRVLLWQPNGDPAKLDDVKPQTLHAGCNGGLKSYKMDDIEARPLFVPSDGKHGGAKRVFRIFPTISEGWIATGECMVFDAKITEDVFLDHFVAAGRFIGWGSMRIEGGGINGRFSVEDLEFGKVA